VVRMNAPQFLLLYDGRKGFPIVLCSAATKGELGFDFPSRLQFLRRAAKNECTST